MTNGIVGGYSAVGPERILSKGEVSQEAQKYLFNDGAVAFVMNRQPKNDTVVREMVTALALDLHATTRRPKQDALRTVGRIELASHGIAMLMMLRKEQASELDNKSKEIKSVEQVIRKLVPGIILYKAEEEEATEGCSVEAQLDAFGWKGMEDDEMRQRTAKIWKSGLQKIQVAEQSQAKARQITWAVTGLGVILLFGLSGGRN